MVRFCFRQDSIQLYMISADFKVKIYNLLSKIFTFDEQNQPMKDIFELMGRIFIAFLFIYEALDALVFYDKTKATMATYGIVWQQDLILTTIIIVLILGGTMVLIGYYANIGALLLLFYWLPFTLIVYSFWNDPPEYQRIHALLFMRGLALSGGLMLLVANGAGKYSIKRLIYVMRLPK